MKYLVFLLAFLNVSFCHAQWQKVFESSPNLAGHSGIAFTDINRGFVSGSEPDGTGYILSTIDGFETYQVDTFPGFYMKAICFPSEEIGYAFGVNSNIMQVFKTINNGVSWEIINDSIAHINPTNMDVSFFNDSVGIFSLGSISVNGDLFKTTNGGITWHNISADFPLGAYGQDISGSRYAGIGYHYIKYSEDYGETFNQVTVIDGTFCSEIELWDNKFIATGTKFQGTVTPEFPYHNYAQIAFGDFPNQNVQVFSFPHFRSFESVERVSSGALYAVARPIPLTYPFQNVFLKSLDGGYTWYGQEILPGSEPNSQLDNLLCLNDTVCYAAYGGLIYKTTNGGGPLLDQVEQIVLSVKEIKDDLNFSIAPNPTSGQVTLRSETEIIKEVKVFDLQGKELLRFYPNDFNVMVDLSKFETGVYLVQITAGDKIRTGKAVRE